MATAQTPIDPDAFDALEAASRDQPSDGYRRFFAPVTTPVIEPRLDAAEVERGTRVLARRLRPAIEFQQADAEQLPYADGPCATNGGLELPVSVKLSSGRRARGREATATGTAG